MKGVLPAYAGMIHPLILAVEPSESAPRVCGDDPHWPIPIVIGSTCSPRMRG